VIADTEQLPLITQLWYPPWQWRPGEIVVAETLPMQLGDQWSLAAGVLTGSDWSDWNQRLRVSLIESPGAARRFEANTWVRLASFEESGRRLVQVTPTEPGVEPSHPLEANLADRIKLLGYDLSPPVGRPGDSLEIALYWQALAPMDRNYTVFVHLVGPGGQLVAQSDREPQWGQIPLPTSTWQPGEELRDQHLLELPPDLPPGNYQLNAGVYYWETLERLPVIENGTPVNNYVMLGNISVE
jgi:hypothetical protein